MPRDYYDILGLDRSADETAIKKAFRKLAQRYHPDVSSEPDAEDRFKEINEAYQVLVDPQKRQMYDRFGHAGVNMGAGAGGFSGGIPDLEDLMEDLLGGIFGGRGRGSSRRRPRRGRDLRYDLRLTLEQSIFGDEIDIELTRWVACEVCEGSGAKVGTSPRTCPTCRGSGQVQQERPGFLVGMITVTDCPTCQGKGSIIDTPCDNCTGRGKVRQPRTLSVNVPPGVDEGTQIRLSGEGEPGELGGPPGNLYVVLSVEEHPVFKRHGHDLLVNVPVNIAQAVLGTSVSVPVLDPETRSKRQQEVKIAPGTQSGERITLRGKGAPKLRPDGRSSGHGDQVVVIDVVIPTKLTTEQRELFEKLAESMGTEVGTGQQKGFFERMASFFGGEPPR
ncbi:MAG: molecular chaperone DnaJ [Anaerolineae bacterium]|nr:molecular chaperone DnaJ [Anaerolineae bacterium]